MHNNVRIQLLFKLKQNFSFGIFAKIDENSGNINDMEYLENWA
jgi:hypothetical protein